MLSICLIYSNNRLPQAQIVVNQLRSFKYYKSFDRIQVCDGAPNVQFHDFKQVIVNRSSKYFIRADLWNSGITKAKYPVVMILDCDRLLCEEFYYNASILKAGNVLYCDNLYQLPKNCNTNDTCENLIRISTSDKKVEFENGTIRPAKNPMSGSVAFHKLDYETFGGMSCEFAGWGFNDTDCYAAAFFHGLRFIKHQAPEFHIYHDYEISRHHLLAMNAYNSVRFYDKWSLPIHSDLFQLYKHLGVSVGYLRKLTLSQFMGNI